MPSTAWPATIASNALPPFSRMRSAARVASAFIAATAKCRPRTIGRIVRAAALVSDSPSCPIVTPARKQITMPTSAAILSDRMKPPSLENLYRAAWSIKSRRPSDEISRLITNSRRRLVRVTSARADHDIRYIHSYLNLALDFDPVALWIVADTVLLSQFQRDARETFRQILHVIGIEKAATGFVRQQTEIPIGASISDVQPLA